MTTAAVVVASTAALDVAAARRLADYGDLDNAGVTQALEQVSRQRWGRRDLPGHLRRIAGVAAVVVADERTRVLVSPEAADERALLAALFRAWPSTATQIVDWDGATRGLLIARAIVHDLRLPATLEGAVPCALADYAAPAAAEHPAPTEQIEAEALRLLAERRLPTADNEPDLAGLAAARYRLWLRRAYCCNRIDADTRARCQAGLDEKRPEPLA